MIDSLKITCPGYDIAADWHNGTVADKVILALPGYTSSKLRQKQLIGGIVEKTGMPALVIDYSGHGVSPFELRDTRPAQHFLEVIYAFDWLKAKYPHAQITVTGSSYGGFLAVQLTKYRAFKKLVLRAPAIYKPAAFYDLWGIRLDDTVAYDKAMHAYRQDSEALATHPLLGRASKFAGDTLVVVHELDEQVAVQTTDAYISAFGADVIIAKGFTHTIDRDGQDEAEIDNYQQQIADWLIS